ncbi:MAG: hypothetical protein QOH62_1624 [Solirubrobacteraceae bacterium]|nr:hypothetical protein [Solirubrobacteraceae bacterium]
MPRFSLDSPRRALLFCLVALAGLPAARAVAAPPPLVVGIGEQKPAMFTDALFTSLAIRDARISVAWDALHSGWQRRALDVWMNAAHLAGVRPLVTFDHSRIESRRRMLPRPERLAHELRLFRKRYPWVRQFASWNEANFCGQKTCHRPELVAAYYHALKKACPSCRILAAELLDMPGMTAWVKAFIHKAGLQPRYWGLHNYLDANRLRTTGTRALLRATKGEIWFTETGGIVRRRNRSKVTFPESVEHAAVATRWVFNKLVPLNPRRIRRVYLYHWNSSTSKDTWDSALVGLNGKPRPAYNVLKSFLVKLRRRSGA